MVAPPLLRAAAAETKVPLFSVTDPVGGKLSVPLTATVTVNACAVVMLDADGVTVTVGVVAVSVQVSEYTVNSVSGSPPKITYSFDEWS
jgi:hypothetical protein